MTAKSSKADETVTAKGLGLRFAGLVGSGCMGLVGVVGLLACRSYGFFSFGQRV